ncbi:MAG TPA: ester cyclase [Acidobacteria bacterium]|nr:ester cyclase [Acidobacteriota bacterium]
MRTLRRPLLALALLLLALPAALPAQDAPIATDPVAADPIAANKALVRRYLIEILTAGHLDRLEELVGPDFLDSTPGAPQDRRGPDVVRTAQQRAREIFPEIEYQIDDLVAEKDKVAALYTVRATSRGSGSSPGRPIKVTGISLFRIDEGKIRELWTVNDQIEMFVQLGYTLQPPQSGQ